MNEKKQKKKIFMLGKNIVCDDNEKQNADLILPTGENCENLKEIASKLGKVVVCDDKE